MIPSEETTEAKRARLRAEKDERDQAAKDAKSAAELEGLELEARFAKELGKLGVDFAMVDASVYGEGFVVVKLGSDLNWRKYVDAVSKSEANPAAEDVFAFTAPAVVHPTAERYAEIVRKRGRLAGRAADALASLHGVAGKVTEGKF